MKTLTGSKKLEKFYTPNSIVELCGELIKKTLKIQREDLIIEPSAGCGAFIPLIKSLSDKYRFIDLKPDHPEVIEKYFLKVKVIIKNKERKVHIIGNPPFRLAVQFIKKCCKFANSISFILPISFMKEFKKKSITLNFHLVAEA